MIEQPAASGSSPGPSPQWRLFVPKLVTALREGYSLAAFRADFFAGLTVAIVALPLAMALAIASGTTPDKGLVTVVVAGLIISALGGSPSRSADRPAPSSSSYSMSSSNSAMTALCLRR